MMKTRPGITKTRRRVPNLPRAVPVHPVFDNYADSTTQPLSTQQVLLPPIASYSLPWPEQFTQDRDLSKISRAELNLPEDKGFELSNALKNVLRTRTNAQDVDDILSYIFSEAKRYAEERKELVRNELKKRLLEVHGTLTPREKGKLRSRREAKVHRVKEQHLEKALKHTIKWLILEFSARTSACSCSR